MLGIDRAIALTLVNRGWGIVAGPLTLVFIVEHLNPVEQGFYFTMGSLLGLQVIFELGLSIVVQQTVSHMMPRISLHHSLAVGDQQDIARLGRFLRDLLRWYLVVAALFVLCVGLCGWTFLNRSGGAADIAWHFAWVLALVGFGANIVANGIFSVIEGMGEVAYVAQGRLIQNFGSILVLLALLHANQRLVALGGLHLASFSLGAAWLSWRYGRLLLGLYRQGALGTRVDWRSEILPFQWRIALSWLAGYLGSQSIVPIVFERLGPVAAGQVGLSVTIMSATSAAALAWVSTKAPLFGRLVAERRFIDLDLLFRTALRLSRWVAVALALTLVISLFVISQFWHGYAERVVPIEAFALLAVAMVFNVQTSSQAIFLRSFRREPFMVLSVVSGFALALSVLLLSIFGDLIIIIWGYAGITCTIALAWATPIFRLSKESFTRA